MINLTGKDSSTEKGRGELSAADPAGNAPSARQGSHIRTEPGPEESRSCIRVVPKSLDVTRESHGTTALDVGDEATLRSPMIGKLSGATAPARHSPAKGTSSQSELIGASAPTKINNPVEQSSSVWPPITQSESVGASALRTKSGRTIKCSKRLDLLVAFVFFCICS